ncbi:nucleoporin NUP42 [Hoplias malabaricus]|uniref:nucleoporin NUP42 n=1 Tax=Hoplias malabaricus TaxID=27720 RepID=UPI0034635E1E
MTVCSFFLQGRCRYGDKCWNEHPRGGGGGGGGGRGGGFGNRVWVNPQSQRSGGDFIQNNSFSRGANEWRGGGGGGGGVGRERDVKNFSFSQNRFSALDSPSSFDRRVSTATDDNEKHLEVIQRDMEVWQSSGQWAFSCYSVLDACITGFVELSPEELRLEYYSRRASGDLQSYVNSMQQLVNQWRSRVQDLRNMNSSTRLAMLSELSNPIPPPASGQGFTSSSAFGSSSSSSSSVFGGGGFGSGAPNSAAFSFAPSSSEFGSAGSAQPSSGGFGSGNSQPSSGGFGFGGSQPSSGGLGSGSSQPSSGGLGSGSSQPSSGGFGSGNSQSSSGGFGGFGTASAVPFSFAPNKSSSGGFASSTGFNFSSTAATSTGLSSSAPPGGGSLFSQASITGVSTGPGSAASGDSLFTPQSDLTADEMREFSAKRFTLGQIPLRPPPAEMLAV